MQSNKNHRMIYAPHHLVFYPLLIALIVFTIRQGLRSAEPELWYALAATQFLLGFAAFMMRQHYALKLQDRVIRNEMRLRYFIATGKNFEPIENRLSFSQIAALRFAGNDEFLPLVDETVSKNLDAKTIKEKIGNWKADDNRV